MRRSEVILIRLRSPDARINPANVYNAHGKIVEPIRHFSLSHLFRPRTLLYMGVWSLIGLGLLYGLMSRDRLELNVLHDRNPQFVKLSDGSIRNGYTIRLLNMIPEERNILLSISDFPGAMMTAIGHENQPAGKALTIRAAPDKAVTIKVFVTAPQVSANAEQIPLVFHASDLSSAETDRYETIFNAPKQGG